MPTKSKQKEFKTPKQMYQAHQLLYNQIIQILKDHDLNFKSVLNNCFGCEWSLKISNINDQFSCKNCLFNINNYESCLNGLWDKVWEYYQGWLDLYSCIYPKKSLNQVIKIAEHIRDFPINPKLSK